MDPIEKGGVLELFRQRLEQLAVATGWPLFEQVAVDVSARESQTFTAYVEWDPETQLYVGIIPGVPGAHTQAVSLDEIRRNLQEVLDLCWEEGEIAG